MSRDRHPAGRPAAPQVHPRWSALARATWLVLVGLTAVLFLAGAPFLFARLQTVCAGLECGGPQPSAERLQSLAERGLSPEFYAGYIVALEVVTSLVYATVAAVILWRRSDERAALLAAFALALFPAAAMNLPAGAAHLPGLRLPAAVAAYLGQVSFTLFLFVFPDGRFVPRWTAWMAAGWAVFSIFLAFLPEALATARAVAPWAFIVCFGVALAAQVYRYRRVSGPVERQQVKWAVAGIAAALGILAVGGALGFIFGWQERMADDVLVYLAVDTLIYLCFSLIPVSIAIAILRSRLYDIDLLIRRTLVYSALTTTLGLVYFGSVTLLQSLLAGVSVQRSSVAIVLSTLGIAALFTPMRRQIRTAIDRRFYRRKYDAARVLAEFGATARDEVELERLTARLVAVAEETMQPEGVGLWLREGNR